MTYISANLNNDVAQQNLANNMVCIGNRYKESLLWVCKTDHHLWHNSVQLMIH